MTTLRAHDGAYFRRVLGNFPTGVVAVTAMDPSGLPVGMAVGSFTSVSLDPPLVAFLPTATSTTWPKIREAGTFAISFLADHQEDVCRALSARGGDKFSRIAWHVGAQGNPLINEAVGWIECELDAVHEAGDHDIVVGRVLDLETPNEMLPLLFFRGGYGRFTPLSFSAWDSDLRPVMKLADLCRPFMERLVADTPGILECGAVSVVGDSLVVIATASSPSGGGSFAPRVGTRVPFHPPLGTLFVAFSGDEQLSDTWLAEASARGPEYVRRLADHVGLARSRGYTERSGEDWQLRLHDLEEAEDEADSAAAVTARQLEVIRRLDAEFEAESDGTSPVRTVNVPVVSPDGRVPMVLSATTVAADASLEVFVDAMQGVARAIAAELAVNVRRA